MVLLGSVLAQQGDFESGEVTAELSRTACGVIFVGATVSGMESLGGFGKEPGVEGDDRVNGI